MRVDIIVTPPSPYILSPRGEEILMVIFYLV
jgi:hypothetical protein